MIDMVFTCRGRIWLMSPQTKAGRAWMNKNYPVGPDGRSLAMGAGVVADFVEAASNDGLTIDVR